MGVASRMPESIFLIFDSSTKLMPHFLDDACPVAGVLLPEDFHVLVPWADIAQAPAPLGLVGFQQPHFLSQRSCQMRNDGICRNDEIERIDKRCGVANI